MTQPLVLKDIILVFLSAIAGGLFAKKLRFPIIIGYLFAGMLFGSFFAGNAQSLATISILAEIGAALLLFILGLEFSLERIKEYGEVVIFASFIQMILSILFGLIIFPYFGLDFYTSLFLGSVFSLSSTAVVVKTLTDKGELNTLHGQISAGWLLMQDLYTLPIIIILPSIGIAIKEGQGTFVSLVSIGKSIFLAFFIFLLVVTAGKKIIPYLIEKVANFSSRELTLLTSTIVFLFFAFLFSQLGFSFALGAFIAGILISSSPAHHSIFAEMRPLRDLFASIFFVSLGFILNLNFILSSFTLIISLVILVIAIKLFISFIMMLLLGYHTKTATMVALSLISVGEFAFILGLLGISSGLISNNTYLTILSVSFISLIISVPVLSASEKIYYLVKSFVSKNVPGVSGFLCNQDKRYYWGKQDLKDHVVILGHGRVGKYISKALDMSAIPYLVIDYNYHLVKDLNSQGLNAIYGDPAEIDVMRFAQLHKAKAVILAYFDRATQETVITNILNLNPSIKLYCRTHFEQDLQKLKSLGVETIVQPEFEAALTLTEKILWLFATNPADIKDKIQKIRREHG